MNNPFEDFDNWDENIAENLTINLPFQQSNKIPRLSTSNKQIRIIGQELGREYSASYIYGRIQTYRQKVSLNTDRVEEMLAQNRPEDAEYFLKATFTYKSKLEKWLELARRRREANITGVTQVNIRRL